MRFDVTIDPEAARQITMKYLAENMILFKNHYITLKKIDRLVQSKSILLGIATIFELSEFVNRFNHELPLEITWDNL